MQLQGLFYELKSNWLYNPQNITFSCWFWTYNQGCLFGKLKINKPKMAYSRDLPKMARQQCGIMD